jgi:hypothetical protein
LPWPQGGGAAFPTRRLKPNSRAYSRGPEPIGRPTSSVSCSIPPQRKRWNRGTMSASKKCTRVPLRGDLSCFRLLIADRSPIDTAPPLDKRMKVDDKL